MRFKDEFRGLVEGIRFSLAGWKYRIIAITFGLVVFGLLYYFFVAKVAGNNIWISVMMSGSLFVTISVVSIMIISFLSGILFSMTFFKFDLFRSVSGRGVFGFIGSGVAAFGVGCPTCGAFLFGLIGLPLALMYLPFGGLELQLVGIFILILGIYLTGKSILGHCNLGERFK